MPCGIAGRVSQDRTLEPWVIDEPELRVAGAGRLKRGDVFTFDTSMIPHMLVISSVFSAANRGPLPTSVNLYPQGKPLRALLFSSQICAKSCLRAVLRAVSEKKGRKKGSGEKRI